jgi:type II secretory pathway component PulC
MEKTSARNLFVIGAVPELEVKPGEVVSLTPKEADRAKDFSLVGIAWSADPEAMVEDGKNKKTYFVKRGQPLDSEVKVVTIFKDKVILTYKGKEFELR